MHHLLSDVYSPLQRHQELQVMHTEIPARTYPSRPELELSLLKSLSIEIPATFLTQTCELKKL